jgi:carbamoyl-phosphate synthase large subunit
VVSSPQVVATCQDKWAAFQFLRAHDLPTPESYLTLDDARRALERGDLRFPLLIKPRWGTSSIGVEYVEDDTELALALAWGEIQARRTILARLGRGFVIQEWLRGQEYGLDVINDLEGRYVATLARRKLVMRSGNTDRAVTVAEPRLEQLGRALGQRLGHVGCLDCDVIATERGVLVLDLNPRLGGGYAFSHLAGADLPAALVAWAAGEEPDPAWLRTRPGVLASKFDDVAVIDGAAPSPEG